MSDISQELIDCVRDTLTRELGSAPAQIEITNGRYKRWSSKRNGKPNNYMTIYTDDTPRLVLGNWQTGVKLVVPLSELIKLSSDEREQMRKDAASAAKVTTKERASAAKRMREEWDSAPPATATKYTRMKAVEPIGLRLDKKDRLLIPVYRDGELISTQWIDGNRNKQFAWNCSYAGGSFTIGEISDDADTILICEGWATGASINAATGRPVIVSFNSTNIKSVAENIRIQYPNARIVICGDDDKKNIEQGLKNGGLEAAKAAARAVNGIYIIPEFSDNPNNEYTDFNDMQIQEGLQAVTDYIENMLTATPESDDDEAENDSIDDFPDDDERDEAKNKNTCSASELLELTSNWETFSDPTGQAYAIIREGQDTTTAPLPGLVTRDFLVITYKNKTHKFASDTAIKQVLDYLSATARRSGDIRKIYHRVAPHDGKIYLDLGKRVVEITANGWAVVDSAPVSFHSHPASLELPEPVRGGSIDELKKFINVTDPNEFVLVVAYLLAALRPNGPYPICCLNGENGSAKSTTQSVLKAIIDPRADTKLKLKSKEEETFVEAATRWMVDYDNLSGISSEASDTVCRISTGATYTKRKLYTDGETVSIPVCRPVIVNGIDQISSRGDFADRSIVLNLRRIADDKRRSEGDLWPEFEKARPRLLGALLDGVVAGLRNMPSTMLAQSPRMADFAKWGVACEPQFWPNGTFLAAYTANAEQAIEDSLQSDPVAQAIITFMEFKDRWEGTATDLLKALSDITPDEVRKDRFISWPRQANKLSGAIARAAKGLRLHGIIVERFKEPGGNRTRMVRVFRDDGRGDRDDTGTNAESAPSVPNYTEIKRNNWGRDDRDDTLRSVSAFCDYEHSSSQLGYETEF